MLSLPDFTDFQTFLKINLDYYDSFVHLRNDRNNYGKTNETRRRCDAGNLASKRYLLGDLFTYADIALFTRVDSLQALNIEVDEKRFPAITRWLNEVRSRPSVSEA